MRPGIVSKMTISNNRSNADPSPRPGIPRCQPHLQRRCPGALAVSVVVTEDRCSQYGTVRSSSLTPRLVSDEPFPSVSQRLFCPPPTYIRDHTGSLPRRDLPLPDLAMGAACIPARTSPGLRDPDRSYGGASGTACRPPGSGLPSLPCWLVDVLGCMLCWPSGNWASANALRLEIHHLRLPHHPPGRLCKRATRNRPPSGTATASTTESYTSSGSTAPTRPRPEAR